MDCRLACGACCIAPSISASIPGMPNGKPAGEYCYNLDPETLLCRLWGSDQYPELCKQFQADKEFCGGSREEAIQILSFLECDTHPRDP